MRRNIPSSMASSKGLILTSILIFTIIGSWGQPEVEDVSGAGPMINFNLSRCDGIWYGVERYRLQFQELNLFKCYTIECTVTGNATWEAGTIQVADFGLSRRFKSDVDLRDLDLGIVIAGASGMLIVKFTIAIGLQQTAMVRGTDYDNYAVITGCSDEPKDKCDSDYIIVLTRQRHPAESVLQKARQVIKDAGIPLVNKVEVDQTDCPDP